MHSPIPAYLEHVLSQCSPNAAGATADYIPELASADPNPLAVALTTLDGTTYTAGEADREFTIQSMSKPFVYALAIAERGLETVLRHVGVEPSGDAFNEISLDPETGRASNPMINAGALTTHALLPGATGAERAEFLRASLSRWAGRELTFDERVYRSERDTAYRNRGIANMLRATNALPAEPDEVVDGYVRQCSILVTARDLSMMAATLATGGIAPRARTRLVESEVVRQTLAVMTSCGMYNGAGDWLTRVGIPAKSGVSGGILGALPARVGLAAFSPRLDRHGNSVRGVQVFERISADMGLHLMRVPDLSRMALRETVTEDSIGHLPDVSARVYHLQGALDFVGAEIVVRAIADDIIDEPDVIIDMTEVFSANTVARQIIASMIQILVSAGKRAHLIDPRKIFDSSDPSLPALASDRFDTLEDLRDALEVR